MKQGENLDTKWRTKGTKDVQTWVGERANKKTNHQHAEARLQPYKRDTRMCDSRKEPLPSACKLQLTCRYANMCILHNDDALNIVFNCSSDIDDCIGQCENGGRCVVGSK